MRALVNLQGHSSASPVTAPEEGEYSKHTQPLSPTHQSRVRITWSGRDSAGHHCVPAQGEVQLGPPCQSVKAIGHTYECTERDPRESRAHRGRELAECTPTQAGSSQSNHKVSHAQQEAMPGVGGKHSAVVPVVRYSQTSSSQSKQLGMLHCTPGSPSRIKSRTSRAL